MTTQGTPWICVLAMLATACDGGSQTPSEATSDVAGLEEARTVDTIPDVPLTPPPDPSETGPFGIELWEAEVILDAGATVIPVDLALPDGEGPSPVVVFTHGFALNASMYQRWRTHLASWGFVAVLPSFPGGFVDPPTHEMLAAWLVGIMDWLEVESETPGGHLEGRLDMERLGLTGHSMGGKISLLVALQDPRVAACFTLDPVDSGPPTGETDGYPSITPELMGDMPIPLGFVGETLDGAPIAGSTMACAPADQNFEEYFAHAPLDAIKIEIIGANHMSFIDEANCGLPCLVCQPATLDHETALGLAQRALIAYYSVTLLDNGAYRAWLVGAPAQADVDAGLITVETTGGF